METTLINIQEPLFSGKIKSWELSVGGYFMKKIKRKGGEKMYEK